MSDLQQQVQDAQREFVQGQRSEIQKSSFSTLNMVIAIVALIIAIMAYEYYKEVDTKLEAQVLDTKTILKNTGSDKTDSEIAGEANAIASGDDLEIDPVEIEGNANAGVSEDIELEIVGFERMYNNRYYSALDKVPR